MFAFRNDPTAIDIATKTTRGTSIREGVSRVPTQARQPTAIAASRIGIIFEIEVEDRFSIRRKEIWSSISTEGCCAEKTLFNVFL